MKSVKLPFILLLILLSHLGLPAQSWNFIKEKDGVKIYTRTPENTSFKCYKGETVFHATMEQLSQYIGNVENRSWWDKTVSEVKVIEAQFGKHAIYYIVYDVPWPMSDRDLCAEVFITNDSIKGIKVVSAKPKEGIVPERKGIVRIKNYWQKWTLTTIGKNSVHAVLEGFVDPGGSIPSWLYNMVIVDTPIKVITGVRQRVEPADSKP